MRFLNNYLKFNESIDDQFFETKEDIKIWLNKMDINDYYVINDNLTVDVNDDVDISCKYLTHIPIQFGMIRGSFECQNNNLKSLKGCPIKVGKYFNCAENQLTSLEYGPKIVDGYYYCYNNKILNLKGCSQNLKYERCDDFMGDEIGDDFFNNPIYVFIDLIYRRLEKSNLSTLINYINEYDVFVGNKLYLSRFKEALYMSDIEEGIKEKFNIEELKDINNQKDSFEEFKYIIID